MALQNKAHNPKEFQVLIAQETAAGDFPAANTFKAIEVEGISMPTWNDLRVMEQRSGTTGRVVNSEDLLRHEEGAVHEISVSGVWTNDLAQILLENALGVEVASSTAGNDVANFITLVSGYEHEAFAHGVAGGSHNTVSIAINGLADFNSSYRFSGAIITNLKLSANSQENGGRINFEFTAQSRNSLSSVGAAKLSGFSDFSTNFKYLANFTQDKKVYNQDVIVDSWELNIENPVAFLGNKSDGGFEGTPEKYLRGVPNLNITSAVTVKYDTNVDTWFNDSRLLTDVSSGALTLANNGTFASATDLGFDIPAGIIQEVSFDEGDYLKLSATIKMIDAGSGYLIRCRPAS